MKDIRITIEGLSYCKRSFSFEVEWINTCCATYAIGSFFRTHYPELDLDEKHFLEFLSSSLTYLQDINFQKDFDS